MEKWEGLKFRLQSQLVLHIPHTQPVYLTLLEVLTVAPAWRSIFTTLAWPLRDADIRAVVQFYMEKEGESS